MPSDSCYATLSAPKNRSAVATQSNLQHGSRMPSDSCYATPSTPRNRSAAFRECTLFLLCRFICRFICSLPGSTFASCSASREHGPRSPNQEPAKTGESRHVKKMRTPRPCQQRRSKQPLAPTRQANKRWSAVSRLRRITKKTNSMDKA